KKISQLEYLLVKRRLCGGPEMTHKEHRGTALTARRFKVLTAGRVLLARGEGWIERPIGASLMQDEGRARGSTTQVHPHQCARRDIPQRNQGRIAGCHAAI